MKNWTRFWLGYCFIVMVWDAFDHEVVLTIIMALCCAIHTHTLRTLKE